MKRLVTSLVFLTSLVANGQTVTLTANDGRPVDTILQQIEKLSGVPINYEDLIYSNPADTIDIASSVVKAPTAGAHLIVPRGGALSLTIPVYSATQNIAGSVATANALNSLLALASNSPVVAGRFKSEAYNLDAYNNVFFVVPTHSRSSRNDMTPVVSALSTPIDLPGVRQTAFETLRAILSQVSRKSGTTINMGTIPIKPFAITETQLAASSEPANHTLARLFNAVSNSGGAPPGLTGLSYHAFFDPVARYYVLNIHIVRDPNPPPTVPPLQPAPGVGSRLGK